MRSSYAQIRKKRLRSFSAAPKTSMAVLFDADLMHLITDFQAGIFRCLVPFFERDKNIDSFRGDELMFLLYISNQKARIWINVLREGKLALVQKLLRCTSKANRALQLHDSRYTTAANSRDILDLAAETATLEIVQFLHEHDVSCSKAAMDRAAARGHLDIVKFLHQNRTEGCSKDILIGILRAPSTSDLANRVACIKYLVEHELLHPNVSHPYECMQVIIQRNLLDIIHLFHTQGMDRFFHITTMDYAAKCGRLDIVRYLHEHRTEGCTSHAMDQAAEHGYLDVVSFLHNNRTEGCTERALTAASLGNHLNVVEFLSSTRTEGWSHPETIDRLAAQGNTSMIEFVYKKDGASAWCSKEAMSAAIAYGHLDTLKYLHDKENDASCHRMAIVDAVEANHVETVEFVLRNREEGLTRRLLSALIRRGKKALIQLVASRRPQLLTTQALVLAVESNELAIVSWMIKEYPHLSSPLVVNLLVKKNKRQLVELHHMLGLNDCFTPAAMDIAARHGLSRLVVFLHTHRSEGCTVRAMDGAAENGHLKVVNYLHTQRTEGCTAYALDKAAERGHLRVVHFLLLQNKPWTSHALNWAVQNHHTAVVKALLANKSPQACMLHAMQHACHPRRIALANLLRRFPIRGCVCEPNEYRLIQQREDNSWFYHNNRVDDEHFSSDEDSDEETEDDEGDMDFVIPMWIHHVENHLDL
ncbi:hypothetical protein AC1031_004498 [Aphanomyces cochlioides]|nr:hypothetical protein AC1031_004498 [Aphanomyces cochlioides]